LMRPVILLNTRAVEASSEAEAIIAHELAHVARMDWAKLLLARVATALFWFNPLVWVLAREAHQLREEAADDAVLAADIADTDYAQLLVGVARHECPGLLLGAHGVAPSKGSLARRVARVLDGASVRGPVARSFALGVFAGAMLVAAPLAALTLTPGGSAKTSRSALVQAPAVAGVSAAPAQAAPPTDVAHIIADGVSTAVAVVSPAVVKSASSKAAAAEAIAAAKETRAAALGHTIVIAQAGAAAARAQALSDAHIDRIIELKTSGVTVEYVNAMQAAAPALRRTDPSDFVGMRSVGVTPQFARDLVAAGFRNITADGLTEARAIGMTGEYARALAAAGVPPDLDAYVQLRAVGVPADYVRSLRRAGYAVTNADRLVELYTVGVGPSDLRLAPPPPPPPPRPPAPPRVQQEDPNDDG
ncbi:MAG: M56 family metallopeptidase, partial [Sphingomicrobium sp.]